MLLRRMAKNTNLSNHLLINNEYLKMLDIITPTGNTYTHSMSQTMPFLMGLFVFIKKRELME